MNEDLTKRLPEQPDSRLEELFRLVKANTAELSELKQVVSNLAHLVEERLRNTQPLGETLNLMRADINQLQEGQQQLQAAVTRLEEGQRKLEEGQWQLRTEMRNVSRLQSHIHDSLVLQYKDLDERVFRLESKNSS